MIDKTDPKNPIGFSISQPEKPIVLIIDDSIDNHTLFQAQLKSEFILLQAHDGAKGILLAKHHKPDLIILDVMMPGDDGFVVCRKLKSQTETQHIPILVITSLRDVHFRREGIESGADDFISRPYMHEQLLFRMRNLLILQQAREQVSLQQKQLQIMQSFAQTMAHEKDSDQLLLTLLTQAQSAVSATQSHLILNDGKHLRIQRETNNLTDAWLDELTNTISITQDPICINEDPHGSVIGLPLHHGDKLAGVLIFAHSTVGQFSKNTLPLMKFLAEQLTIATKNLPPESALAEQKTVSGNFLSGITDLILMVSASGVVTNFNNASADALELTKDSLGKSLSTFPKLLPLKMLADRVEESAVSDKLILNGISYHVNISPASGSSQIIVLNNLDIANQQYSTDSYKDIKAKLSRYMSPFNVNRALTQQSGEFSYQQKHAVMLFADLRNFTTLLNRADAKAGINVLNTFFKEMIQLVHHYHGTIFDIAGDELMVGFNIPDPQENPQERAMQTAIAMQLAFSKLHIHWKKAYGVSVGLGIGIEQGDVVIGAVGSEKRANLAVVGESVNVAHRLQALAKDGEIIVSGEVVRFFKKNNNSPLPLSEFESRPPVILKGLEKPRSLYCVTISR